MGIYFNVTLVSELDVCQKHACHVTDVTFSYSWGEAEVKK